MSDKVVETRCKMMDRHGRYTGEERWMTYDQMADHIRNSPGDYEPTRDTRDRN